MRIRATPLRIAIVALLFAGAVHSQSDRPITMLAGCDTGDLTAAKLGRERLLQAAGLNANSFVVVTGGALSAVGRPSQQADQFPLALLELAGVDVVNLAHRDCARMSSTVKGSKVPCISATFRRPEWPAHVVLERGGSRVAFIGAAVRSASVELAGKVEGLQYVEPVPAIRAAIAEVRGKAERIVLLADAPPTVVARWVAECKGVDIAVASACGGVPTTFEGAPNLFAASSGGRAWTVVEAGAPSRQILITESSKASAEFAAKAKEFGVHESSVEITAPKATATESGALAKLEPGRIQQTSIHESNRAATLTIHSVALLDSFGGCEAPGGGRFLVVDTSWQNILTPELLRGQLFPVAYQVRPLSNHLYCVADGHKSLRHASVSGIAGVLDWGGLSLPLPGSEARGRLLFEVAKGMVPTDVDLRFYDYAHGPMFVPLVRKSEPQRGKPVVAAQKNEVLAAEIHALERSDAANGMDLLELEFRALSTVVMEADATAYDPKAKPGTKIEVGTVADWKDWRRHTQIVVDGEFAYGPTEESTLPEMPRFLPDVVTGDALVFRVPRTARSVELLCGMPNARLPGSGKVIRPEPFRFLLDGKVGALPERKAIVSIEDDVFRVAVTEQRTASEIGGESAGDGNRFLILAVTVANAGGKGETFQTQKQLRIARSDGGEGAVDPASVAGLRPPIELLWIPKGERRSFEVAFRVPANETKPRLSYLGLSMAKVFDLPPLEGAAVAEEKPPVKTPPPIRPVEKPPVTPPPTAKPITPPPGLAKLEGGALDGFRPAAVTGKDVELQVLDARLARSARGSKADKGMILLVLQLAWKRTGESGEFKSGRLNEVIRLRSQGLFLQELWGSSYSKKEGFLPSFFELDDKQPSLTAKAVFEIPEQFSDRLALVHAADRDNVLVVPLRTAAGALPTLPEVATVDNEVVTITVHEIFDPGEEVRKRIADAGYLPKAKKMIALRVSAATKDEPRDLGYIHKGWRLIAGGDFPCPAYFVKRYGPAGGWPVWGNRRSALPGVPEYGVLLFAVPDPKLSLELELAMGGFRLKGGKVLADPCPRFLLREGTRRTKPKPLATLKSKDWAVELLGVETSAMRNYSLVALDLWLRAPDRAADWGFSNSDVLILDQTGRRQSGCGEDHLAFERTERFQLPPGGERRFTARFFLNERGNRLWMRFPSACPDQMACLPNPWVGSDFERLAPSGELKAFPSTGKKFEYELPPLFPESQVKGIEGVGLTGQQVNEAIRKGAAYLATQHTKGFSGTEPRHALVILALLHSGELHKYPELEKQAIECLETRKFRSSYDLALTAMGLAHVDPDRYRSRIRNIAQALVDDQQTKGGWGYMSEMCRKVEPGLPAAAAEPEKGGSEPEGRIAVDDGGPIPDWPGTGETETITLERTLPLIDKYCDNSCSQYAVLGLLAASHAGVMVPRETWERAARWYASAHSSRRGWGYRRGGNSSGSMTTAGLAGFAVARHQLGGLEPESELILRTGLDWLGRNYRLDENPNAAGSWQYYYLYGLERAGRLLAKEFIGDHEWYAEGARYLVDNQAGDGHWKGKDSHQPVQDTCFAILFLTRATEKLGEKKAPPTGPGWLKVEARSASGAMVFILDASASMLADLGSETRFDAARRVVLEVLQGGGAGLEVALRAYGHRYRSNKKEAITDTELVVEFGPPDRAELAKALGKMRCRGKTPLTLSLQEAIKDLEKATSKDRRVLLLTDGLESNRRAKPLEAAAAIKAASARLDVVCLCMESTELLENMAKAGGGTCYSAADAEQLLAALKTAVVGDVAFRVLGADGKEVAQGKSGDKLELPAGPYTVEVALPGGAQQIKAWIHQDRTTKLRVR